MILSSSGSTSSYVGHAPIVGRRTPLRFSFTKAKESRCGVWLVPFSMLTAGTKAAAVLLRRKAPIMRRSIIFREPDRVGLRRDYLYPLTHREGAAQFC